MSMLGQRTNAPPALGQRIVITGVEKIGKTTLACDAPNALLIPIEQGFASQTCDRLPMINWWEEIEGVCSELIAATQASPVMDDGSPNPGYIAPGTSLVWDSATAVERLIHDYVLRKDGAWGAGNPNNVTMTSAHGGYGKGYNLATELFGKWLSWMDMLSMRGVHSIITAHVFAASVVDPAYGEYNSWDIRLHSPKNEKTFGAREMITEWADMIGFLHTPLFVTKGKDDTLAKGVDAGKGRVLAVERTPSWIAGNRFKLRGEIVVPLEQGWNHIAAAVYASTERRIDLYKREMLAMAAPVDAPPPAPVEVAL